MSHIPWQQHALDIEAYLAALEPPRFSAGSRVYVGRVLSVLEQAAFDVRFSRLAEKGEDAGPLAREYIEALFPSPPPPIDARSWWRRLAWRLLRRGSGPPVIPLAPVDVFFALPRSAQLTYFADFTRSRLKNVHPAGSGIDGRKELN